MRDDYFPGKQDSRRTLLRIKPPGTGADLRGWAPSYSHDVPRGSKAKAQAGNSYGHPSVGEHLVWDMSTSTEISRKPIRMEA